MPTHFENLLKYMSNISHYETASLYDDITSDKFVRYDTERCLCYYFDTDTALWGEVGVNFISMKIHRLLRPKIIKRISKITNIIAKISDDKESKLINDELKKIKGLLKSIDTNSFIISTAREYIKLLKTEILEFNTDPDVVHFTNGTYDLIHQRFRKRQPKDYASKCLSFEYKDKAKKRHIEKIYKIFHQINNDDEKQTTFKLSFYAYCLTGRTEAKKMLYNIGHLASNGKSTEFHIMESCFPIYVNKIDRDTFNSNYTKRHKVFASIKAPVRMIFIEEMKEKLLDITALKDFIDGGKNMNEVLFGTTINIEIQAKITVAGNSDPNFRNDRGISRRGYLVYHNNEFVEAHKYKKDVKGLYLQDETLIDLFKKDSYKLALFHLLIPYINAMYEKKKYRNNIINTNIPLKNFKDLCEENDKFKQFIDNFIIKTGNIKDRMSKDEIVNLFNSKNKTYLTWQHLRNDIKRLGLTYDKAVRCNGIRGCIVGVKVNDDDSDNEFSD